MLRNRPRPDSWKLRITECGHEIVCIGQNLRHSALNIGKESSLPRPQKCEQCNIEQKGISVLFIRMSKRKTGIHPTFDNFIRIHSSFYSLLTSSTMPCGQYNCGGGARLWWDKDVDNHDPTKQWYWWRANAIQTHIDTKGQIILDGCSNRMKNAKQLIPRGLSVLSL